MLACPLPQVGLCSLGGRHRFSYQFLLPGPETSSNSKERGITKQALVTAHRWQRWPRGHKRSNVSTNPHALPQHKPSRELEGCHSVVWSPHPRLELGNKQKGSSYFWEFIAGGGTMGALCSLHSPDTTQWKLQSLLDALSRWGILLVIFFALLLESAWISSLC
jgi:hypothetical protein